MPESQNGRIGGGVLKDNLELYQGGAGKDYLNFKNTSSDIALLHIDAVNSKLGIQNESPSDELQIPETIGSLGLDADYTNIDFITIENSSITSNSGDLNVLVQGGSSGQIVATAIATTDLKFDFNTISTTTTDTNIELRPDGTGEVNIRSNWNNTGNIHATGDITFGGNLTLGDDHRDSVFFDAELASDIVPDSQQTRDLGRGGKRWLNLYTDVLTSGSVNTLAMDVGGVSIALRQGNTFYVSVEGDDLHSGDHPQDPFATIARALDAADSSLGGPVTIHVFPGTYEEACPLVVPPHVTIRGADLRNTIVKPDTSSQSEDVFHIQEDCTIEDLTIKDFYYDSFLNTGYAFRFTFGGTVNTRSPYIRNCTIITKGSVTSASDPRGFDAGDAGKGAWIDGSELNQQASLEASMLFHSVTFITPGVDAITMTNGVRVEWLNSFSYFANRSLYATRGTTGFELPDSTTRYGAEIRSIGSASVYGNYGAVADGASTLMYLVNHNFAYIGTGKDKENDKTLVLQANEAVEINAGKIHYTSQDHTGTFRVGENFFVDFETGQTSFDAGDLTFSGVSSILVGDNTDFTYIDGSRVDTGNIRINGNTVTTINGQLNLSPVTEVLNLDTNPGLVLPNNTDLNRPEQTADLRYNTETNLFEGYADTGNVAFGGVFSDDRETFIRTNNTTGAITFGFNGVQVGQINDYGLELHGLSDEDILINDNRITTTLSNSNLELRRKEFTSLRDQFGDSSTYNVSTCAISADYICIADTTFNSNEGVVYVYNSDGIYLREISNPDVSLGYFGYSLAINGTSLAVGKLNGDEVYIFDLTDGSTTLTIADPNTTPSDFFGRSIAYDGTYVIASSIGYDGGSLDQGRVYQFNATTGSLLHTYENPAPDVNDNFGEVLRLNSNYLVIGSPSDYLSGTDNGSVYVYNPSTYAEIESIDTDLDTVYPWQGANAPAAGFAAGDNLSLNGNLLAISYSNIEASDGGDNRQGAIIIYNLLTSSRTHEIFNPKGQAYTNLQQGVYVSYGSTDDFLGRDVLVLDDNGDLYASATAQGLIYKFTAASDYVEWERTFPGEQSYRNSKFAIANDKIIHESKLYEEYSEGTADKGYSVKVDDIVLRDNTIIHKQNDAFSVGGTDDGYIKFDYATGLVIPFGSDSDRYEDPEIGHTRWNTDSEILETWNGTSWQRAAGEGEEVTDDVLKELVDIYTIVLG